MATAADAMDAAAAAAAAVTATNSRMDTMEQHQITMTTQLAGSAQQLQALLGGAGGSGGAGGGGSSGGAGGSGGSAGVVPPPAPVVTSQRRRIDPSCLDKLPGDVSLSQLRAWTSRWNDFSQLNQLSAYPINEQMAAFRMVLDPAMHQVVEVALGISPTSVATPADVIGQIRDYIRSKRNIALDRVAFEECKQGTTETFDEFYIRLKNLAEAANLCIACADERMATRIMAGSCGKNQLIVKLNLKNRKNAVKNCIKQKKTQRKKINKNYKSSNTIVLSFCLTV